jgi:4-oxalocrotonate tautomerase
MPFVRIWLDTSVHTEPGVIGECVHRGMVDALGVPEGDHFQVISRQGPGELVYDRSFLGFDRTDGIVFIQILLAAGRDVHRKKALYLTITELLSAVCGVRPDDVFITLVEIPPENFSFGGGQAQFADKLPPHLAQPVAGGEEPAS